MEKYPILLFFQDFAMASIASKITLVASCMASLGIVAYVSIENDYANVGQSLFYNSFIHVITLNPPIATFTHDDFHGPP